MYDYKIEKLLDRIPFDNYQLIVIKFSDKQGKIYKGLGVSPPPWLGEGHLWDEYISNYQPLIIDYKQALKLCGFIENLLAGPLPVKTKIETHGPSIRMDFKRFTKDWHDGGGYKGIVCFHKHSSLSLFSRMTITKAAMIRLREGINKLYEIKNEPLTEASIEPEP